MKNWRKILSKISLSDLPVGSYAIEVVQGKDQIGEKNH